MPEVMPLDGAFTVLLLLLISGVSAGIVLPPTNVTLSCRNFIVVVSWEYSDQQPQTRFRVAVRGSAGPHVEETTEHRYDLSRFVWASEERYLGFHSAAVTAVRGGNKSEEVQSETFTFNYLKTAHIECQLSFPPVDVNESESGATVAFINPLHFYRELEQADKPNDGSFKFTVSSDSGDSDGFCTARQKKCKHDVTFPEDVEKCVTLKGWLFAGNGIGEVAFRKTGRICALKATAEASVLMWVIPLLVLVLIVSVIIAICKVKAWTMKVPSTPKPLTTKLKPHREGELRYAAVSAADISAVGLTNKSCKNPSLISEDEEDDLQGDSSPPPAMLYVEGDLPEGYRGEDDSADDSAKTVSINLDDEDEEEEVSPYDRPHVLQVDMGDGDMATGYKER